MLTRRQIEILDDYRGRAEEVVRLEDMAQRHGVSVRTLQNDVAGIRKELPGRGMELASISSRGLVLHVTDRTAADAFLNALHERFSGERHFDDPAFRVAWLVKRLIECDGWLRSDDLAEEMFISRSRLSHDLAEAKAVLARYGIELVSKPHRGIRAVGPETGMRRCIVQENLTALDGRGGARQIEGGLDRQQLDAIGGIVMQALSDARYIISDIALQNVIVHTGIAVARIRLGRLSESTGSSEDIERAYGRDWRIADQIMRRCCDAFDIPYAAVEVATLALNLNGKREFDRDDCINDTVSMLVSRGIEQVRKVHGVDFSNDIDLHIALGMHLTPLLTRIQAGMLMANPLRYRIKRELTFAHDCASTFAFACLPELSGDRAEDEISFLALHFSTSLDAMDTVAGARNLLLVTSHKKSETILIRQKIVQWFRSIQQIDVAPRAALPQIDVDAYNIALTTEEALARDDARFILVDFFPSDLDYRKIELALRGFRSVKDLTDVFSRRLFMHRAAASRQDAIDMLLGRAQDEGFADERLRESVLLHETITSSYLGNGLAAPHPEHLVSDRTFIATMVLERPVDWDGHQVDLVLLVSIEKDNPTAYRLWYYLSSLVSDRAALDRLRAAPAYETLLDAVVAVYG